MLFIIVAVILYFRWWSLRTIFHFALLNNTFLPDTWPFGRAQSIAVVLVHPPPPPQPTTTT